MGPSHPPFCKPGISPSAVGAAAASASWNTLEAASEAMTEAWMLATADWTASSKAGNSPPREAWVATEAAGRRRPREER